MNGRIERDLKIEQKIESLVADRGDIIQMFVEFQDGSPATRKEYVLRVLNFLNYIEEKKGIHCTENDLQKILPADISGYLKSLQYKKDARGNIQKTSTSYRALTWSAINSFFKFLVVNRYIDTNPCSDVKRPSIKDPIPQHHLEVEQIRSLNSVYEKRVQNPNLESNRNPMLFSRDHCILTFFITMGIRASALVSINLDDIDMKKRVVKITDKGEKTYTKQISDSAYKALMDYLKDRKQIPNSNMTNALFVSNGRGQRVSYYSVRLIVKRLTREVGNEVSPHALRHTYGSLVYEKSGGDLNFTRQMLNHANAQVTLRYINNDNSGKEREIQKFMDDIMG